MVINFRIHMLEENIREVEIRSEERLETERKRNREAIQRLDREKQLEIENYSIRLHTLEKEHGQLEHEALQLRSQAERLKQEKADLEEQVQRALRFMISRFEMVAKFLIQRSWIEKTTFLDLLAASTLFFCSCQNLDLR